MSWLRDHADRLTRQTRDWSVRMSAQWWPAPATLLDGATHVRRARDDRFGRTRFGRLLAMIVGAQRHAGLLVIGIEGPWGSGKSSALSLAIEQLTRTRRHREVVLSAWRSSTQDQFLANLSFSIATALRRDWQSSWWRLAFAKLRRQPLPIVVAITVPLLMLGGIIAFPEIRGWTRWLAESDPRKLAEGAGLFGLPILAYLFSKASKPLSDGFAILLQPSGLDKIGSLERFAFDFDVLGAAQPRGSRFIVVVEDLDRCSPEHIGDILSSIAQLATHPRADRLAFLLAYDRDVLIDGIMAGPVSRLARDEEKDKSELRGIAEDYLNRVVQIELPLPLVDPAAAPETVWRVPQVPTLLRGVAISIGIVAWFIAYFGALPEKHYAGILLTSLLALSATEFCVGLLHGRTERYTPPADWDAADSAIAPWLPDEPRRKARVRSRARVALLANEGTGMTAWTALSVSMLADRWPTSFNPASLRLADDRKLDIAQDYHEIGLTTMIEEMKARGLPIDHFDDARQVLPVVATFKR